MALLQWDYPDYDGGTPVTHYSIHINSGIQQTTSETSYEAEFVYNTTVNVSVTAYNCVGHSDPIIVQIFHDGRLINFILNACKMGFIVYTIRWLFHTYLFFF